MFGSYACGGADEMSDIDLLVVSPEFDGVVSRDFVNRLWRIAARTDSRIEPIPCGEKQWLNDNSNAIIEVARREGQTVKKSGNG
ncbi:nucleotidyltransferase domain-containing protein [Limihaloglobus sulfuriphilus]|uniref:nucleotidyltransferase domain-containing protein n=1 Tax=Limihaloglobus sulfuriphilus TaxID=1851148 RepID=UPI00214FEC9F|nr:nucleotidyltransferase domain-containing protein [Limihaloglobus sulfuriphilus]